MIHRSRRPIRKEVLRICERQMVDSKLRGLRIGSWSTATLASQRHRGDDQRVALIQVEEGHQVVGDWVAAGHLYKE